MSLRFVRALLALALLGAAARAQTVWYVDATRPSGGGGTSWADAFDDLQLALDATRAGDQIWVADGIYRPSLLGDAADPRSASFSLPNGANLFGGFAGGEPSVAKRAGSVDKTVLDGDIGVFGDASDNAYQVVEVKLQHAAQLDGFTIRNGNGLGSSVPVRRGAGIAVGGASRAFLTRCILRDNTADVGAALSAVNLSVIGLKSCVVRDNVAASKGGGLYCMTSFFASYDTLWVGNKARQDGGAVFVTSTDIGGGGDMVRFVNDVFHDNAAARGGAFALAGSQFIKGALAGTCCTIAFNEAQIGGAIFAETSTTAKAKLLLVDSIVWNNSASVAAQIAGQGSTITVMHCDVAGGFVGSGNIALDPQFVDALHRNLRLRSGSSANDAGHDGLLTNDALDIDGDGNTLEILPLDFDGTRRLTNDPLAKDVGIPLGRLPIVDMGAFEL